MITQEHEAGIIALGRTGKNIEKRIIVENETDRLSVLRVNDIQTLYWVTVKEYWPTQPDYIVISFIEEKFDCEAVRIPSKVKKFSFECDGNEP